MPSVAFNKFDAFIEHVAEGVHDLAADTFKVALSNTLPDASDSVLADITQIANGDGYTTGGNTAAVTSSSQTGGTYKLVLASPAVWTSSGAGMDTFQYVVLYNDTPTSPADPLVGWWDFGSAVSLAAGETFTVTFDPTAGVMQGTIS